MPSREEVTSDISKLIKDIDLRNSIVIIPHGLTDLDALASSFLLKEIMIARGYNTVIYAPEISRETKLILEEFRITNFLKGVLTEVKLSDFCVFLVDFVNPSRVSERIQRVIKAAKAIYAIDHHDVNPPENVKALIVKAKSLTEYLVLQLAEIKEIDRELLILALLGILQDTALLQNTGVLTKRALDYIRSRININEIIKKFKSRRKTVDEIIARFKGIKRAQLIRINDYIIAVTEIGSYEASVASALIQVGADIAIVLSEHKEGKKIIRISVRSKIDSVNMSSLLSEIANKYQGVGGGHPRAAGLAIELSKVSKSKLVQEITTEIINRLKKANFHTKEENY